jgi:hypothetical protein
MHTRVQLASASMGSEWSARPTPAFPLHQNPHNEYRQNGYDDAPKSCYRFVPNIDIIQTCHHQTDNQNVKGGTGDSQSIALEGIRLLAGF